MMDDFLAERKEALLSMDRETILAYAAKWGEDLSSRTGDAFWGAVHMARTGAKDLPMAERSKSKAWLHARGWRSMDDGDLP